MEGNGSDSRRTTSFQDQIISPIPHASAEKAKKVQARRTRPWLRPAAKAQLPAAIRAATASPMSSTPMVTSSLTQRLYVQAMKTRDTIAAAVAKAMNGPQVWNPSPVTTTGRRWTSVSPGFCCTPRE